MREILFRGKNIIADSPNDTTHNYWRGGSLLQMHSGTYIVDYDDSIYDLCEKDEVWPDTVGQFTGFCDKNGKKIFEGDIVMIYDRLLKVIYDVDYGEFEFDDPLDQLCLCADYNGCEVIGNIWDNPELLKEEIDISKSTVHVSGRLSDLYPYDNVFDLVGLPIKDECENVIGRITDVYGFNKRKQASEQRMRDKS